jgi:hypothetical protein
VELLQGLVTGVVATSTGRTLMARGLENPAERQGYQCQNPRGTWALIELLVYSHGVLNMVIYPPNPLAGQGPKLDTRIIPANLSCSFQEMKLCLEVIPRQAVIPKLSRSPITQALPRRSWLRHESSGALT